MSAISLDNCMGFVILEGVREKAGSDEPPPPTCRLADDIAVLASEEKEIADAVEHKL